MEGRDLGRCVVCLVSSSSSYFFFLLVLGNGGVEEEFLRREMALRKLGFMKRVCA